MKKYMTKGTKYEVYANITEVDVDRETESCIWINGRRILKNTEWGIYHKSWGVAYDHLLKQAEQKVAAAENKLIKAIERFDAVKGMTNPDPGEEA